MSKLTKEEITTKLTEYNIYLKEDIGYTNDLMLKELGDYQLTQNPKLQTFGTTYVQSLDSFQLIDHLKDNEDYYTEELHPLNSDNWVAELKSNGFRCLVIYSPEVGFEFFSRVTSVKTFLNTNLTDKVLLIRRGIVKPPESFKNTFNYRFVLDCEAMVDKSDLILDSVEYTSVEDFLQAVLGSSPERSKQFQLDGCNVYFKVFDILYLEKDPAKPVLSKFNYKDPKTPITKEQFMWVESHFGEFLKSSSFDIKIKPDKVSKTGKVTKTKQFWEKAPGLLICQYLYSLKDSLKYDVRKLPFGRRRQLRKAVVNFLDANNLPFYLIESQDGDILNYAENLIREGEEGAIIKNLKAPYFSALASSRSHRACFKIKQSIVQLLENMGESADFDVFITGANPPKSKNITDMIGSLSCSIYVQDKDGNSNIHEIANISGIGHDIKKELTVINSETGKPELNTKYLNSVITIAGMGLSHKSLRFHHATLKNNKLEMKAKEPIQCTYTRDKLDKMISVRGK